jgi:acyl dehydratase
VDYRLKAHNTATASTNKIHDDAVAQSLGFRGGLVPGVDIYAYLCHLPAKHWGPSWLTNGTILARFESPVYDGDEVDVVATPTSEARLDLTLSDRSGAPCAQGRATMPAEAVHRPALDAWPSGSPPVDPPMASPETLANTSFGQIGATFRADRAGDYLDGIGENLALFREERLAHPGWLLRFANSVLTANVRMGPWIHVESNTQFFGIVSDGDRVETRALVTDVRERGGHRLVDLDVLQVVGDRPVARTFHTAIYEPRRT